MNICEMCGTANGELDTECRICGHSLASRMETVTAAATQPQQVATPVAERQAQGDDSPHLQVSSFRHATATGAPPMLGNAQQAEPVPTEPKPALPGFMQEGARMHAPAPAPVELISASDLPDWIRQIAEADAAKAAAEAAEAAQAAAAEVAASRRPLPGEAPAAAGPSASWLSKSSTAQEAGDPWAATDEPVPAAWGAADHSAQQQAPYPTISPSSWTPSAYEDAGTSKKGRFGRSQRSSSSGEPVYRNRIVQLAVLVLLFALLAAMVL